MPPPITKINLARIKAWLNERLPAKDETVPADVLEARRRNAEETGQPVSEQGPAPTGRREDFDDRVVIRLVTELWKEALLGSGLDEKSETADALFTYIADGIVESGRPPGGTIIPEDLPGQSDLEARAFGVLRQREVDVDSFPRSGISQHKLPLKGMQIGAILKGLVEAGRITQDVADAVIDPTAFQRDPEVGREARAVALSLRRDFDGFMEAARSAPGTDSGSLRQAFTNVLQSETPGEVASGNSIFQSVGLAGVSAEDIDSFLGNQDAFVSDVINRLDPSFNPSTTVDEEQTTTLSQAHIRAKDVFKRQFDALVAGGTEPAEAAVGLIRQLQDLTQEDFQGLIQGVTQETQALEAQERAENPATRKKEFNDFLINNGVDPASISDQARSALELRMPPEGITEEFSREFERMLPSLQQQQRNIEFAEKPAGQRQADIGGALGFGATTFGTQEGGFTFRTPTQTSQQRALGASQASAAAALDARGISPGDIGGLVTPGRTFGLDRGDLPVEGFAQDVPGRIAQIRAEQPTIEGLLPFQVPGSLSEELQFGANPPTPPLTFGQPTIGGRPSAPRSREFPLFELDVPDSAEFQELAGRLAGGDIDLQRVLLSRFGSPGFRQEAIADARTRALAERESDRFSVDRTFNREIGRFESTRERVRPTAGTTTLPSRASITRFAERELPRFRREFEASPVFAEREVQRRNRRLRRPGQATFRRLGSGR